MRKKRNTAAKIQIKLFEVTLLSILTIFTSIGIGSSLFLGICMYKKENKLLIYNIVPCIFFIVISMMFKMYSNRSLIELWTFNLISLIILVIYNIAVIKWKI